MLGRASLVLLALSCGGTVVVDPPEKENPAGGPGGALECTWSPGYVCCADDGACEDCFRDDAACESIHIPECLSGSVRCGHSARHQCAVEQSCWNGEGECYSTPNGPVTVMVCEVP